MKWKDKNRENKMFYVINEDLNDSFYYYIIEPWLLHTITSEILLCIYKVWYGDEDDTPGGVVVVYGTRRVELPNGMVLYYHYSELNPLTITFEVPGILKTVIIKKNKSKVEIMLPSEKKIEIDW